MLILTDSRLKLVGKSLDFILQRDNLPFDIEIKVIRGGRLNDLRELGLEILKDAQYHLVLVAGGVNDLTTLNRSTWIVSPVFDDLGHMIDTITDGLHKTKNDPYQQEFIKHQCSWFQITI